MITCHSRAKIRLLIYYIIYIEREWEIKYITWMCGYNKHQSWFRIDRLKTTSVPCIGRGSFISFHSIPFRSLTLRVVPLSSLLSKSSEIVCNTFARLFDFLNSDNEFIHSYRHRTRFWRIDQHTCIVNAQLFCLGFCAAGFSCILLYWSFNLLVYTIRIRNVNEKVYCTALNDQLCWFANLFCCFTFYI